MCECIELDDLIEKSRIGRITATFRQRANEKKIHNEATI